MKASRCFIIFSFN